MSQGLIRGKEQAMDDAAVSDRNSPDALDELNRLAGLAGTKSAIPDTPANEAAFGRPGGGRGDGAFPQVHKVSLVELGSRAELAFVVKPCHRNEAVIAWGLRRHVGPGMLVLADRE